MKAVDTVDRTIRNQRPPSWFILWLPFLVFVTVWITALFAIGEFFPEIPHYAFIVAVILVQTIVFPLLMPLGWSGPVSRMKLGERLILNRGHRVKIEKIREIKFDDDPLEDYAESPLPYPMCQVTVFIKPKRKYHLIASRGDTIRVREWAESHSIRVLDPQGLSKG